MTVDGRRFSQGIGVAETKTGYDAMKRPTANSCPSSSSIEASHRVIVDRRLSPTDDKFYSQHDKLFHSTDKRTEVGTELIRGVCKSLSSHESL